MPSIPTCSACGSRDDLHLVIAGQPPGSRVEGRVLVYCPGCRQGHREIVCASIPLPLVTADLFVGLYELGVTASDPEQACEIVFASAKKRTVQRAREALGRRLGSAR